ncbi:MAG TPA: T9SS type A sorting domain-containing protein [Flavobacteriaceae bacterium]|jgi:hypothetical protein
MKTRLLIILCFGILSTSAQTIWDGPNITFTKTNFADWTQQANQDRITSNVWITRKNTQGIFNINQEAGYVTTSPEDTEWAYGTTSNIGALTFKTWVETHGNNPPSMIGQDMVVHLISEDIYIDIKFLSWTSAAGGGGFSYERSTDSGLSTEEFSISKFSIFPNPSHSEINLQLPTSVTNASVKVFNILGKVVYSSSIYEVPINIANWNNGIYLVQVSDLENTKTKRFIKL